MMNRSEMIALGCLAAFVWTGHADEESSVLDGGWRISAGAVYDSGVKTDIQFAPRQTYATPFRRTSGKVSRKRAEELAWGKSSGTRTTYVNMRPGKDNAESTVDTDDAGYEHDGKTFNYSFPAAVWDEDTAFELGYAEFEDITVNAASDASKMSSVNDDAAMPGVSVQLSRHLYHDDDNHWGVEMALGVQYARRNDVFKSSSVWQNGNSKKTSGVLNSVFTASGELAEVLPGSRQDPEIKDILWGDDDAIGGDFFAINPNDIAENEWGGESVSHSDGGSLYASGDYDNLELMLLLQPYYDVFSWLSVNATLGMVVSRQSMEMSFTMLRNGKLDYCRDSDFSQWDVYGVAGLGLMLNYKDVTLSGDFLARFFDRDMEIDDTYYKGTVSRGNWMFRLGLGYEF